MSSIDYPTTADRAHTIALETLSDSGYAVELARGAAFNPIRFGVVGGPFF